MLLQERSWLSNNFVEAAGRLEGEGGGEYVAAVLIDLSKAFDCSSHDILLSKLSAYGLSNEFVQLLNSYLSGRK